MAQDALTPFLRLTKPVVNDPAGEDLWGYKVNTNFDLIDAYAASFGNVITDPPQDGRVYGRGTPYAWVPVVTQADFDDAITDADNVNDAQNAAITGKEPSIAAGTTADYWRGDKTWQVLTWAAVAGKPATFPPTLPIASSDVTGLDAKQASQDTAIAANTTALGGKEPTITAGNPAYFWAGDKTWKPVPAAGIGEAPTDGQLYSRKGSIAGWVVASAGAVVSDTPPTGMPVSTIWWNSASGGLFIDYQDPNTRQWVMVNAAGMPEAPKNGLPFARKDGAWFDLTATLNAYIDQSELTAALGPYATTAALNNYLLLSGGTVGWLVSNTNISATGYMSCGPYLAVNNGYISAVNNSAAQYCVTGSGAAQAGGVLGYVAGNSYYGILGYSGYTVWGSGAAHFYSGVDVRAQDYLRALSYSAILVGHPTTTSAATGYLNTGGTVYRSTSSAAFKTAIEPMADEYADKILQLKPIFYRPNEMTDDDPTWSRFGFSAEDVYAVDFRFSVVDRKVQRTPDGKRAQFATKPGIQPNPEHIAWTALPPEERTLPMPEPHIHWDEPTGEAIFLDGVEPVNIDLNAIVAGLVNLVQRQEARIQSLEARLGV